MNDYYYLAVNTKNTTAAYVGEENQRLRWI